MFTLCLQAAAKPKAALKAAAKPKAVAKPKAAATTAVKKAPAAKKKAVLEERNVATSDDMVVDEGDVSVVVVSPPPWSPLTRSGLAGRCDGDGWTTRRSQGGEEEDSIGDLCQGAPPPLCAPCF
jgi:hypothetical protein